VHSFYLDASGLAKRYSAEPGTPLINHLFSNVSPNRFYVFNVNMGEVVSLLVRKRNAGIISTARLNQALLDFNAEIVTPTVVRRLVADDVLVEASFALI